MYYLQGGITKSKKFNTVLGAKRHREEFANFARVQVIRLKTEDGTLIATYNYQDNRGWVVTPGRPSTLFVELARRCR